MAWVACGVLGIAGLAGCDEHRPLAHDLRLDDPAARLSGLQEGAALVTQLHAVAVVVHWSGRVRALDVDYTALAQADRPVMLVVQFLGQLPATDFVALDVAVQAALKRANDAGVKLAGVEVDYRGSAYRLDAYSTMLAHWRSALLPRGLRLLSSAESDWVVSADFKALAATVDQFVLFTDDVAERNVGYFDRDTTLDGLRQFARRAGKPFWLALPAGGGVVYRDDKAVLLGTEAYPPSDEVRQTKKVRKVALAVLPEQIRAVLEQITKDRPAQLEGVYWVGRFKGEQPPAWTNATWRAIVSGASMPDALKVRAHATSQPGMWSIAVHNPFKVDIGLPETVSLQAACTFSIGEAGYASWHDKAANQVGLRRLRAATIGPGQSVSIGLAHCGQAPEATVVPAR